MTTLIEVEVRRLLARRLVRALVAVAILAVAAGALITFLVSRAATDEELAERERLRRQAVQTCVEASDEVPVPERITRREYCESIVPPVRNQRFDIRIMPAVLQGTAVPAVLLAWILGASAIGAEWQTRSLVTTLTWEPRRGRLLTAKAIAVALVTAGAVIVLQELLTVALLPAAVFRGTTEALGGALIWEMTGVVVRTAALAAATSVIAFSLAAIGRGTTAALGLGAAYLFIVERLVALFAGEQQGWLIVPNAVVFVAGETLPFLPGRNVLEAALILAVYTEAALLAAVTVFSRRDVA